MHIDGELQILAYQNYRFDGVSDGEEGSNYESATIIAPLQFSGICCACLDKVST